jgi:hypothetical protein
MEPRSLRVGRVPGELLAPGRAPVGPLFGALVAGGERATAGASTVASKIWTVLARAPTAGDHAAPPARLSTTSSRDVLCGAPFARTLSSQDRRWTSSPHQHRRPPRARSTPSSTPSPSAANARAPRATTSFDTQHVSRRVPPGCFGCVVPAPGRVWRLLNSPRPTGGRRVLPGPGATTPETPRPRPAPPQPQPRTQPSRRLTAQPPPRCTSPRPSRRRRRAAGRASGPGRGRDPG